ncbi:alkaline phosphatase family protein [Gammaproteobacteria bacterium]|nr:alkaline phosphatase family protein [Gammaproteobacteria bacterium]
MLPDNRTFLIGLDGYEVSFADKMMNQGELPSLKSIKENSARFLLEHGSAKRTGLAFEHISSGLSPNAGNRWSAIYFDKDNYRAWQEDVRFEPFTKHLSAKAVVFDTPYFDIEKDSRVRGIVAWGAHDPGTKLASHPPSLLDEMTTRFGHYPAQDWIYGFAWPSADKCQAMGEQLTQAVQRRTEVIRWLFKERLPDWDLGFTVISELHSASEGLWHGIDPQHPLHQLPSSSAAANGFKEVYRAVDRLLGDILKNFPKVTLVCFSMHGMGPNESDVTSMALLPELLYRRSFGKRMIRPRPEWLSATGGVPLLAEGELWHIPLAYPSIDQRLKYKLIETLTPLAKRVLARNSPGLLKLARSSRLAWMPAAHYQPHWKNMTAFALPAFYDGRIRVNLQGRESHGLVSPDHYREFCEELSMFLMRCTDPHTGKPVVRNIVHSVKSDPLDIEASESDMTIEWNGAALAIEHPELGVIGPLPYRRPGGHTGHYGVTYISGPAVKPGDYGVRSSFDVTPSVFDLLGETYNSGLSGNSFIHQIY